MNGPEHKPGWSSVVDFYDGLAGDYHLAYGDRWESSVRQHESARELNAPLQTAIADFRDLSGVPGEFDVVVSCDNAIPHLLDDAEIGVAFAEMRNKLRPGGLLVISTRDYERALAERPRTAPPLDILGLPPTRLPSISPSWWPGDRASWRERCLCHESRR